MMDEEDESATTPVSQQNRSSQQDNESSQVDPRLMLEEATRAPLEEASRTRLPPGSPERQSAEARVTQSVSSPTVVAPTQTRYYMERLVPISVSAKEHQWLAAACLAVSVNPRSIRRLVNVLKLMKLIWQAQEKTQAQPNEAMSHACVFFLAMCASKSNTLLRGMRAIFDEMENSMQIPTEPNLEKLVDKVAGLASVPNRDLVDDVLRAVSWDGDADTWNDVKSHLRLVRCFSLIGAYTVSDRAGIAAEQKKKDDIIAAELKKKQDSDHAAAEQTTE